MSENTLITAAIVAVAYILVASRFRKFAYKAKLEAISLASDVYFDQRTPETLKEVVASDLEEDAREISPWFIAVMVLPVLVSAFVTPVSKAGSDMRNLPKDLDAKFDAYMNASIASAIFRSPLAFLLVVIQGILILAVAAVLVAPNLISSVIFRLISSKDDQDGSSQNRYRPAGG